MISQRYLQAIANGNIGEVFILMEQPDSARIYLNHAKELLGPLYDEPSFHFYFTGLYASLALLEGNLPEAEKLLLQPYDTLLVNPQYIYFNNRRLQDLYFRKQDYKKAYNYLLQAETYNDSIRTVKVRNNIAEIDARYSQDTTILKKNIQITLAENKVLQWKYTTGVSVMLFVLILALVIGLVFYYRKINELRHLKQVSTITGLRMEIIRNRLSPHFMFNALNLIMPSFGKYKELEEPFRLLVQILRDNLISSEQIAVPLQQEINRVQNYLRFHDLKQTGIIRVDWTIHPEISTEQPIRSMFIQIPVENAIKYAFQPACDNAHLQISIRPEADANAGANAEPEARDKINAIRITIEDNGVGYHPDRTVDLRQGTGSGLQMLRRTVDLLNDNNKTAITFKIENKCDDVPPGQGTRVTLIMPLNTIYIL
jgi:sensor histidine kinase YesM